MPPLKNSKIDKVEIDLSDARPTSEEMAGYLLRDHFPDPYFNAQKEGSVLTITPGNGSGSGIAEGMQRGPGVISKKLLALEAFNTRLGVIVRVFPEGDQQGVTLEKKRQVT